MNILTTLATIKHLNIRKEGPDDDKVLAVDIKFGDAAAPMELLARILGTDDTSMVMLSFWDQDGNLRYAGMEPVTSWCVIEGCTAKIGGLVLQGVKIGKFKARLDSEFKITVEFAVSVTSPPSNAVPVLADYVQDDIRVEVTKAQEELDLSAQEPQADSEAEPIKRRRWCNCKIHHDEINGSCQEGLIGLQDCPYYEAAGGASVHARECKHCQHDEACHELVEVEPA